MIHGQNENHKDYFGYDSNRFEYLPTLIGIMDNETREGIKQELGGALGEEATKRCRIVGWTAFDHYPQIREAFTLKDKEDLLAKIELDSSREIYVHFTQNVHPDSVYMQKTPLSSERKQEDYNYEIKVTQAVFEAASDLGKKLVVKPHPGEEHSVNITKELTDRHVFIYLPAKACSSQQLMLAADSVTAGRSTCLTEACLLDRNIGGIFTEEKGHTWEKAFPPIALGAIPYAKEWDEVKEVLQKVTSLDETVRAQLAHDRKKFSVDGKASERAAQLVYELLGLK